MIIGINGNEANVTHRVGVGQYAFELLSHLAKDQVSDTKYQIYLQDNPKEDLPPESADWKYKVLPGRGLWTLTTLQKQLILEKDKPDVFFTPTHYAPLYLPMPSVISIMDMSFERFPQYFKKKDLYQLKYWTKLSGNQAKRILTISHFSQKEICELYHLPDKKVIVTYPGYDDQRFNLSVKSAGGQAKIKNLLKKYKIGDRGYLLFLGTLQPRKNLERLIEAYSRLTNCPWKLVIAGMINEGRGGWKNEGVFAKIKALGLEDNTVFTGYVPDEEVPYLMAGSGAYLLPSLYEGFGIPPIEAMAVGTLAVVSKVSSLPEICGLAATYIDDPYSIGSIQQALQEVVLQKASERAKRVQLGLEWVKRYNWETTAKQTLEILRQTAANK